MTNGKRNCLSCGRYWDLYDTPPYCSRKVNFPPGETAATFRCERWEIKPSKKTCLTCVAEPPRTPGADVEMACAHNILVGRHPTGDDFDRSPNFYCNRWILRPEGPEEKDPADGKDEEVMRLRAELAIERGKARAAGDELALVRRANGAIGEAFSREWERHHVVKKEVDRLSAELSREQLARSGLEEERDALREIVTRLRGEGAEATNLRRAR